MVYSGNSYRTPPCPPPAPPPRSRPPAATAPAPAAPSRAEGKARASRNALKHGLAALQHFVLEDEAPDELEDLIATFAEETGAASEIEARLARRMAIAFWKGERAERIEVALFDAAPKLRPPQAGFEWEEADPLTTFDLKRFNADPRLPGPAGQGDQPLPEGAAPAAPRRARGCTDEPERTPQNEPESRPPPPTTTPDSTCQRPGTPSKTNPGPNRGYPAGAGAGGSSTGLPPPTTGPSRKRRMSAQVVLPIAAPRQGSLVLRNLVR